MCVPCFGLFRSRFGSLVPCLSVLVWPVPNLMADPIEDFSPTVATSLPVPDPDWSRRLESLELRVKDLEAGLAAARLDITEDQNVTRHFRSSVGNLIERSNALMNEYSFMQRSRSAFLLAFRTALTSVIDVLRTFRDTAV